MSTVAPSDAEVAARSFPRRWRALFARAAGDDETTDVLERSGAPALAMGAARALARAADRLQGRGPAPVEDPLEAVDAEATRLADAIAATPSGGWDEDRVGVVSDAIEESAALLREAERDVEAARLAS